MSESERLKICVYAISKNEAQFVDRFCDSAADADLILIADTGSTDDTIEKALARGALVGNICISPWRFDHARIAALALIPGDFDVCISLDLDEVLEPGWRAEIERVWIKGQTTQLRYFFDWGHGIKFRYEKIHARKGYRWHHPCHEYPKADSRMPVVWAETDMLLVTHHPDPTKSRGQYLDLLKMSIEEDPHCPRNAFYYARELSFWGKHREAIDQVNRYLALPGATWANERCYAYRVAAGSWEALGDRGQAERALMLAASEAPNTREPWCELALLMHKSARWEECFAYSMRALKIERRDWVYTCDPKVWGAWPHDLASVSAYHLGLYDLSLEQARRAVELAPDDPRMRGNLRLLQAAAEANGWTKRVESGSIGQAAE